jgi:trans-2,3-dihydro-3-hydroxyanthranilate isomerase
MQAIALEMAFSETTFVFPAEKTDTDFRVRIFAPRGELPAAGHPTIGTAFALVHEGRIPKQRSEVRLGLNIGPTHVALDWKSDQLYFAWMTQRLPEFGPPLTGREALAPALGLPERDIRSDLPVQAVSTGVPFLFVPLVSRAAVNRAELERSGFQRFCGLAGVEELGVFVFSTESAHDGATVFSRMFAPVFGIFKKIPQLAQRAGHWGAISFTMAQ